MLWYAMVLFLTAWGVECCTLCLKRALRMRPTISAAWTSVPSALPLSSARPRKMRVYMSGVAEGEGNSLCPSMSGCEKDGDDEPATPSDDADSDTDTNTNTDTDTASLDDTARKFMVCAIKWYRNTLSPIMPPNCRFQPSCSNYAIQAIQEFGAWRGSWLTAWRLLRCNPIGPSGFDPPMWPPPGLAFLSE
jgi:putative membrane protein insertion efficiency factor